MVLRSAVCLLTLLLLHASALAEKRIALLIGNEAYASQIGQLANPHNDVALLEQTLKGLDFEVAILHAGLGALTRAINAYSRRLQAAGPNAIGFFYYSGHGASDGSTNYLIPVDVKTTETGELWDQSLQLTEITRKPLKPKSKSVACDSFRRLVTAIPYASPTRRKCARHSFCRSRCCRGSHLCRSWYVWHSTPHQGFDVEVGNESCKQHHDHKVRHADDGRIEIWRQSPQECNSQKHLIHSPADENIEAQQHACQVELHPSPPWNLEVRRRDAKHDHDQRRNAKPVREKERSETIDTESCDAGDKHCRDIDSTPQPVLGCTLGSHKNRSPDTDGNQARDEMHPSERQEVKVHDVRASSETHGGVLSINP